MAQAVKYTVRPIGDLEPADYNPRRISDEALEGLGNAIDEFGLVQPIVWNKRTGRVVGGHQRLRVLKDRGISDVDVAEVDLTPEREKALNVALNNPHIAGDFDSSLQELLREIREEDSELFRDVALDRLLEEDAADSGGGDEVPDLPTECITKPGDIWVMGQHRLICGDCRVADDVKRLFGHERASIAFTSPPYASQRKYDESSGFKPINPDDYVEWFDAVQANTRTVLSEHGSWFVNIKEHCDDGQRSLYVKDLTLAHVRDWGWRFVDEFCWDKMGGVPGRWANRFKNSWEPIFHFSVSGAFPFYPKRVGRESADLVKYSADNTRTHTGFLGGKNPRFSGIAMPSNVLRMGNAKASATRSHTAEFPVGLPSFFYLAYTQPGDICYDPFMGSGTSIIAGERLERQVYGVEISPAYCDVIVERWQNETGGKATR